MKLTIDFETVDELLTKLHAFTQELRPPQMVQVGFDPTLPDTDKTVACEVTTSGVVEQDLAIVEPEMKPKRTRKPKVETVEAMAPLADRPANSRPHTTNITEVTNEPEVKAEDPKLSNFKANFSQTLFILLQQGKLDQAYVGEKVKYYGLKNIIEMKDDMQKVEHFYNTLVTEGRL